MSDKIEMTTTHIDEGQSFKWPAESYFIANVCEPSGWRCELFGMGPLGFSISPVKGQVPNAFWRWMQYLAFGNRWIRVEK